MCKCAVCNACYGQHRQLPMATGCSCKYVSWVMTPFSDEHSRLSGTEAHDKFSDFFNSPYGEKNENVNV